jgi:hypothetical protein
MALGIWLKTLCEYLLDAPLKNLGDYSLDVRQGNKCQNLRRRSRPGRFGYDLRLGGMWLYSSYYPTPFKRSVTKFVELRELDKYAHNDHDDEAGF